MHYLAAVSVTDRVRNLPQKVQPMVYCQFLAVQLHELVQPLVARLRPQKEDRPELTFRRHISAKNSWVVQ
jgi:glucose-6-phosphate-specific signal transduction histidine kinase